MAENNPNDRGKSGKSGASKQTDAETTQRLPQFQQPIDRWFTDQPDGDDEGGDE